MEQLCWLLQPPDRGDALQPCPGAAHSSWPAGSKLVQLFIFLMRLLQTHRRGSKSTGGSRQALKTLLTTTVSPKPAPPSNMGLFFCFL